MKKQTDWKLRQIEMTNNYEYASAVLQFDRVYFLYAIAKYDIERSTFSFEFAWCLATNNN